MVLDKHPNDFGPPVFVAIDRPGQTVAVKSPRRALELLLVQWPTRDGTMYRHARHACFLATEGSIASKAARKAFARAAKEAGILLEKRDLGSLEAP